jgi:hypothetical protein
VDLQRLPRLPSKRLDIRWPRLRTISQPVSALQGLGCFVILGWLWGINLYVFNSFRINYVFIFELDPRTTMSYKVRTT